MKIETEINEQHHAHLTVEVEAERLDSARQRAALKIARKMKVPGFRPGKAPYAVILRQVGETAIMEEALELLIDEIYPDVIKEATIQPYGPGHLEEVKSMDPLTLIFHVPLEPVAHLGDYRSIQKPYELAEVTEDQIQNVIEELRDNNAILEPVERAAQVGDQVTLLMSGERKNAEVDDNPTLMREQSTPINILPEDNENNDEEWPFPGFSRYLVGLSVGDERTVDYTWPDDSPSERLRGIEAEFSFKVEGVKSRTLPEVNDEFAVSLGEFNTVDDLRKNIREMLENQSRSSYNKIYDNEIIDQAIEHTRFQYPPEMLENEINTLTEELSSRLAQQSMELDTYLKMRQIDRDTLKEEMKPVAEKRIQRTLFLVALGKAENIQVAPEELQDEALHTINYLSQTLPEKEARKLSRRDVYSNVVGNVLAEMVQQKTIERFRQIASSQVEQVDAAMETTEQPLDDQPEIEESVTQPLVDASKVEESDGDIVSTGEEGPSEPSASE